jgi:(S)-ureidoglycine aminohydrolase
MKKTLFIVILLIPSLAFAQRDSIQSAVYFWKDPVKQNSKNILSSVLFEGMAYDMEWLQVTANVLLPSKIKTKVEVPGNEEQLLIIKSGNLTIGRDSSYLIGTASVALFMPGETFLLQNTGKDSCRYYVMKYRSKKPIDIERGNIAGGSLVKDWNKIEFKPNDKGGRRDFFERPTAMCKRFEMHITTLKEGLKSHDPHMHHAAEIIIVIDGNTEMQIGDKLHKGKKGSVYYLGSNILHGIRNDGIGDCSYFAFQFE